MVWVEYSRLRKFLIDKYLSFSKRGAKTPSHSLLNLIIKIFYHDLVFNAILNKYIINIFRKIHSFVPILIYIIKIAKL